MRKIFTLTLIFIVGITSAFSQEYKGTQASERFKGAAMLRMKTNSELPDYILLNPADQFDYSRLTSWMKDHFSTSSDMDVVQGRTEHDKLKNMLHYRMMQSFKGVDVWDANFIVHTKAGKVEAINGKLYKNISPVNTPVISEQQALAAAMKYINAVRYKWEVPGADNLLKKITGNPEATYYPKGKLVLIPVADNAHHYSFMFNIYADKPLKRSEVFVDAQNGEILKENNKIYEVDTVGSAVTKYLGLKKITTDFFLESNYRLRETGRGNGIETYNLLQGTDNAAAVDFTDADNYWNNINAQKDEIATDGHYGAEMTYDYYLHKQNRNSIDDQGYKLISFVHYDVNYSNAFWDGQEMTYGDGGSTYSPFTAIDICGHEITHGLTEFTANLTYAYEPGALNEGYSDIFGTMVEFYGDTLGADWLMGEDIGQAFRSMSNPNQFQLPDTYQGNNWATGDGDNGGVHTNSGVICYWFYLTAQGGSGTNDNNHGYSVTGIGKDNAADVAYRTLTVYLTPDMKYEDARFYSIISASDLFGACSPEMATVTNAFHAVGIGNAYTPGVTCDFDASSQSYCTLPAQVQFSNSTTNGSTFHWDFGDGNSSTLYAPTHTYTNGGNYSVQLISDGGNCGSDTLLKIDFIVVNPPVTPVVTSASSCGGAASLTLTAIAPDSVRWYMTPTGGVPFFTGTSYTTPLLTQSQNYYVSNQVVTPTVYGGKTNKNNGGGYFNYSNSHWEIFDVYAPLRIKSVKVYANSAGVRNVELRNSSGTVLISTNVSISDGESRITLNFDVPVGTDYELAGPGNPDLYRDKTGASFPYTLPGLLSITGTSANQEPTYYYYFYDWEVVPQACASQRVMVAAYVSFEDPIPSFTAMLSGGGFTVHFTNTTAEGDTFLWDFGDGETSTLENPVHAYANFGTYSVTLTVTNSCGTANTSQNLNLVLGIPELKENQGLQISPNPAYTFFEASFNVLGENNAIIQLIDILGRTVWSQNLTALRINQMIKVPVEKLSPGIYTVVLKTSERKLVQKLVKK